MSDRRGRERSVESLYPDDPAWAEEIWRDRFEVHELPGGFGMIRHAAKLLDLPEEAATEVINASSATKL